MIYSVGVLNMLTGEFLTFEVKAANAANARLIAQDQAVKAHALTDHPMWLAMDEVLPVWVEPLKAVKKA